MSSAAERYRAAWELKTIKQIEKEIRSYRMYFEKHKDSFFHECHPDSLSDGNRMIILKDLLRDKQNDKIN